MDQLPVAAPVPVVIPDAAAAPIPVSAANLHRVWHHAPGTCWGRVAFRGI